MPLLTPTLPCQLLPPKAPPFLPHLLTWRFRRLSKAFIRRHLINSSRRLLATRRMHLLDGPDRHTSRGVRRGRIHEVCRSRDWQWRSGTRGRHAGRHARRRMVLMCTESDTGADGDEDDGRRGEASGRVAASDIAVAEFAAVTTVVVALPEGQD